MKYMWMVLVVCLSMGTLYGQEFSEERQESQKESAEQEQGQTGEVPEQDKHDASQTMFEHWSAYIDNWTQWLNPCFEQSLSTMPGIAWAYPRYKGYIKGATLLSIVLVIACSKPVKYMVRTIKEWHAISDDAYGARVLAAKEQCEHQCLVCSTAKT